MIACDVCRDVSRKATEHRVSIAHVVPGAQRASAVTLDSESVELCEHCRQAVFTQVREVIRRAVTHEVRTP